MGQLAAKLQAEPAAAVFEQGGQAKTIWPSRSCAKLVVLLDGGVLG